MIILKGKNLGERQKELNVKVNEAASRNVDFEHIKEETEQSDVDKLFKIDLASKYTNIDYIIEVLKSGDSLHISRALKCTWMFDDEFSNIINVDYLQHNVFPLMSLKMKKKMLTTMSLHIKNHDRAAAFFKYCMEIKLTKLALKFIIFASDSFKLEFIKEYANWLGYLTNNNCYKHFIGSSFTLADAYLSTLSGKSSKITFMNGISYLYSISDVKYLDMFEKHVDIKPYYNSTYLGLRISKDILKRHKQRVLKRPSTYINFLNKTSVQKYSTEEDAKVYLLGLLPDDVDTYWNEHFCNHYSHILNSISPENRFGFIKKIFNDKYPKQIFEIGIQFYNLQYYKYMTEEEREKWALEQVANQEEILGIGKNYIWYKFVNFDKAFEEIKKLIMITTDGSKRAEMMHILVESAKRQRDLEKLFKYYYDRHNNEQRYVKENFIDWVSLNHNVYEFDKDCWTAFNKIFQNLEVYSMLDNTCKGDFKIIALIYHVVNKIDVHESLRLYISTNMFFYTLKLNTDKLTKEQEEMVYQYLFNFYMNKINEFDAAPYENEVKYQARKFVYFILDLLVNYDRTKKDIPEVVMKFMKLDWDEFKCHRLFHEQLKQTTQEDLIRYLKTDAKLAVDTLPLVKKNIEISYMFPIGQLLKKIKVYFSNDISKDYLKFFNELLSEEQLYRKVAQAATYGIFQLASDSYKVEFMVKYAPIESKINRSEMDEKLLNVQEAICSTVFYSRPPVPLKNVLMYIKGDYVRSCLPLFNSYLANLPLPLCIEFVGAILNTPLSIQKHGVRLAFACFNAENLKKLITYVWKKTKNISLRLIIYKALYNKIIDEKEHPQTALFETLIAFTLDVNEDDDNELFSILISGRLPGHLVSDYLHAVWKAVGALPNTSNINIKRMSDVIQYMRCMIDKIRQDVIGPIVETFIKGVFERPELLDGESNSDAKQLYEQKWELAVAHITYIQKKDDLDTKLELAKSVIKQCLGVFNLASEKYVGRNLCFYFLKKLRKASYGQDYKRYKFVNTIFENVLQILEESLLIEDIYMIKWEIKIDVAAREALIDIEECLTGANGDQNENSVPIKNIIINFGTAFGNLIKDFIEKDLYFKSFLPIIQDKLMDAANKIADNTQCLESNDVLVITSRVLTELKTIETYLFALNIIPLDYNSHYVKDYEAVVNEIKELDNIEIKCGMRQKFVNTDSKPRALLNM